MNLLEHLEFLRTFDSFEIGMKEVYNISFDTKKLNISNRNINSLTGIDNFINLKELYCCDNQITNLGLQSNPDFALQNQCILPSSLKILYCYNNKITNLDNLPDSLEIIYCYNNKITSLKNLPNSLRELYCGNNQITSLDNLPSSLIDLDCSDNPIINLNFQNKYNCSLKVLNCYNTKITTLDFGHKSNFTKQNNCNLPSSLKILNCDTLDLSGNLLERYNIETITKLNELGHIKDDQYEETLLQIRNLKIKKAK